MLAIIRIVCLVISIWWIIAVVADLLYFMITHNPSDVTSFMCNPFCIICFPMFELKMYQGAFWWLMGLGVVILTAIFFV